MSGSGSSEARDDLNTAYEGAVVWTLFGTSLIMIGVIGTRTFKEIMKFDREYLSMLKDSYTVFYAAFAIMSMIFKLFILDTHYKDEIRSSRRCSMFISDYMPQFFLAISSCLVAAKAVMLLFMSKKDNIENHVANRNKRYKVSGIVLLTLIVILSIIMLVRFINSCYRVIDNFLQDPPFPRLRTHIHFEIIYIVKILSLSILLACFLMLKSNKYFFQGQSMLFNIFIAFFCLILLSMVAIVMLLMSETIVANTVNFIVLFFFDLAYILLMTKAVLQFR